MIKNISHLKHPKFIAIGIGVVVSILIVVFGYQLFSGTFTRASDSMPQDVIVSNISSNSTTLGWTTGIDVQGVIEYGVSPTSLNAFKPEEQKAKQHSVDLTLLSPNTTYYFQLRVGDSKYDNGGVPWTFTTRPANAVQDPAVTPTPSQLLLPTPTTSPDAVKPTPIQSLVIPAEGSTPAVAQVCDTTDCEVMKSKFGKGCTTQDYFRCVNHVTPSP